jgi:hypothetical protein
MQPSWPILYLNAPLNLPVPDTAGDSWPRRARSRNVDPGAASALELEWSGRDFAVHYRHWAARPGGVAFTVEADGRPVAVGAVRDGRMGPGRVLDHLAIAPDADPTPALVAAFTSTAVRGTSADPGPADPDPADPDPAARLTFAVPGPSPAVALLLSLGCRITDHDTFCATDPDLFDPARLVPDPSFG